MDYGACNVIYIDRRATDDVCDAGENRYEYERRDDQEDQAKVQEHEQAYKHKHRYLQQEIQHKDDGNVPLSTTTAATTTTATTSMTSAAANAGAALDKFDASRRRPAYHQRHPSDVCRNLEVILGTFARGKNNMVHTCRVTAGETFLNSTGKPLFVFGCLNNNRPLLRTVLNTFT